MNSNRNLIHLNRNEYFFPHPPEVIRALKSPYEENFISHYAKPYELENLKLAIAQKYNVDKNSLLLGHGAEDIFVKILSWFRKEIHSVVMEDFSWTNYHHIAEGFQYKVSTIPVLETDTFFAFNTLGFYDKLSEVSQSIIFVTCPNNPTGHGIDLSEFYGLASAFPQHIFILDSVYNEVCSENYASLFSLSNVILVGSFSKFFGMPGLRLGYAIGSLPKAFQLNLGLQPSTISAAMAALKNIDAYEQNRNYMLTFAKNLLRKDYKNVQIYPTQAPFFLAKIKNNRVQFEEIEQATGILPKYIHRENEIFIRFGLGPKMICEKIENYLAYLELDN